MVKENLNYSCLDGCLIFAYPTKSWHLNYVSKGLVSCTLRGEWVAGFIKDQSFVLFSINLRKFVLAKVGQLWKVRHAISLQYLIWRSTPSLDLNLFIFSALLLPFSSLHLKFTSWIYFDKGVVPLIMLVRDVFCWRISNNYRIILFNNYFSLLDDQTWFKKILH